MKKLLRHIAIIFIIVLTTFLVVLTIYKLKLNKEVGFNKIELSTDKLEINSLKIDTDLYKENIINDIVVNYDYTYVIDNEYISGTIFIGKDHLLYMVDENKNEYKVSDINFKTIYVSKEENEINRLIYLISTDNDVYALSMINKSISDVALEKLNINIKVKNFTNLKIKNYGLLTNNDLIVLSNDGNMYNIKNEIRYDDKIISLDGMYYVYNDIILNTYGNILKDESNNSYKIKYYVEFNDDERPFKDAFSIIITESNDIIYTRENTNELCIYNKKIKKIDYETLDNSIEVKLKITFKDNSQIQMNGIYTELYGFKK